VKGGEETKACVLKVGIATGLKRHKMYAKIGERSLKACSVNVNSRSVYHCHQSIKSISTSHDSLRLRSIFTNCEATLISFSGTESFETLVDSMARVQRSLIYGCNTLRSASHSLTSSSGLSPVCNDIISCHTSLSASYPGCNIISQNSLNPRIR
jgi:hypothetical protein